MTRQTLAALQPAPLSRDLDIEVGLALNAEMPDRPGCVPVGRALSPAVKSALRAKLEDIREYLAPASQQQIIVPVSEMFVSLASRGGSSMDVKTRALAYVEILSGLPVWAIKGACDDFRFGRRGDKVWCPTPAQVREAAEDKIGGWSHRVSRIESALNLLPVGDEQQDGPRTVPQRVREVMAELRAASDPDKPRSIMENTRDEARAWLENEAANPRPLPMLSDAAKKSMFFATPTARAAE